MKGRFAEKSLSFSEKLCCVISLLEKAQKEGKYISHQNINVVSAFIPWRKCIHYWKTAPLLTGFPKTDFILPLMICPAIFVRLRSGL